MEVGRLKYQLGNLVGARLRYHEGRDIARELDNNLLQARARRCLAVMAVAQNQYNDAEEVFKDEASLHQSLGEKQELARILH